MFVWAAIKYLWIKAGLNFKTMAINKPSPKWFRIAKPIWSATENTILLALLLFYREDSLPLLVYKIISSYVKQLLEILLDSQSEYFAPKIDTLPTTTIE